MSLGLSMQRRHQPRVRWEAAAFLVETMMLVLFIMASLAVLTAMYAQAAQRSTESDELSGAVAMAISAAERFSADPAAMPQRMEQDGLTLVCDVTADEREAGTLYRATIRVYADNAGGADGAGSGPASATPVYQVSTATYASGA